MRPRPKAVDYLLAAIAPAFIIGMINCLVFFLILVVYRGEFSERLMYILGLYTFGVVLIARIAIEQSRALAMSYMAAIGLATLLVSLRFVQFPSPLQIIAIPLLLGFLILIAFLADRITFDCTLIDERVDSSGEGLLQSLGMMSSTLKSGRKKHNPGVWILYFSLLALPLFGLLQLAIPAREASSRNAAFWFLVGYLFCGMMLLLTTNFLGLRRYLRQRNVEMPGSMATMWLLSGAIGMTLLLVVCMILPLPGRSAGLIELPGFLTSPEGLVASRWGWGSEGVRGDSNGSAAIQESKGEKDSNQNNGGNAEQASENDSRISKESSNEKGSRATGSQDGRSENENSASNNESRSSQGNRNQSNQRQPSANQNANQQNAKQQNDSAKGESPSDNSRGENASKSDKPLNRSKTDRAESKGEKNGEGQSTASEKDASESRPRQDDPSQRNESQDANSREQKPSLQERGDNQGKGTQTPSSTSTPSTNFRLPDLGNLSAVVKWATVAILTLLLAIYLAVHGKTLWQSLWGFMGREQEKLPHPSIATSKGKQMVSFSSFRNPFQGQGGRSNPAQVVRITFDALEAWAREHGCERGTQDTPEEFLSKLAHSHQIQRDSLMKLSLHYNKIAYANWNLTATDVAAHESLWRWMNDRS